MPYPSFNDSPQDFATRSLVITEEELPVFESQAARSDPIRGFQMRRKWDTRYTGSDCGTLCVCVCVCVCVHACVHVWGCMYTLMCDVSLIDNLKGGDFTRYIAAICWNLQTSPALAILTLSRLLFLASLSFVVCAALKKLQQKLVYCDISHQITAATIKLLLFTPRNIDDYEKCTELLQELRTDFAVTSCLISGPEWTEHLKASKLKKQTKLLNTATGKPQGNVKIYWKHCT